MATLLISALASDSNFSMCCSKCCEFILLNNCTNVETLFNTCYGFTTIVLHRIHCYMSQIDSITNNNMMHLRQFEITHCSGYTIDSILYLIRCCDNLCSLNLSSFDMWATDRERCIEIVESICQTQGHKFRRLQIDGSYDTLRYVLPAAYHLLKGLTNLSGGSGHTQFQILLDTIKNDTQTKLKNLNCFDSSA